VIVPTNLCRIATVRKFRTVQIEGKRKVNRVIEHYNLDMIIAIGYRVNTKRGTQFRQWANPVLKNYLVIYLPAKKSKTYSFSNGEKYT